MSMQQYRVPEDITITWESSPDGDDHLYQRDGSLFRRHYTAFSSNHRQRYKGYMSFIVPGRLGNVEVESFDVEEHTRNRGVGSAILRSAFKHLKEEGHQLVFSDEISVAALHARRKVLGGHAMLFYESRDYMNPIYPLTFAGALAMAEHDERIAQTGDYAQIDQACGAVVDLSAIDTDDWLLPVAYSEFRESYSSVK